MSVIKQILRLYSQGHKFKEMERITSISRNTIRKYVRLSEISSYGLEELLTWEDEKLEIYFNTQTAPTPERKNKLEELLPWFEEQLSNSINESLPVGYYGVNTGKNMAMDTAMLTSAATWKDTRKIRLAVCISIIFRQTKPTLTLQAKSFPTLTKLPER